MERLTVTHEDLILMASPFTFDPSIVHLFLALSTGTEYRVQVLMNSELKSKPTRLAQIVNHQQVTLMHATSPLLLQ